MISKVLPEFWRHYNGLPRSVRDQARKQFRLWSEDPLYPSLHFKKVDRAQDIWSVRVNDDYRALAIKQDGILYWYWIGPHREYEKLLPGE